MTSSDDQASQPPPPIPSGHQIRRQDGGRHQKSEPARLVAPGVSISGWTLNESRGGVRLVVEEQVQVDQLFDVTIGDDAAVTRPARIVWVRESPDGCVIGLAYSDVEAGSIPPPPELLATDATAGTDDP